MSDFSHDFSILMNAVSNLNGVCAIGKSGGAALPEAGESDIDVFVFCDRIPSADSRRAVAEALRPAVTDAVCSDKAGKHWGHCDFVFYGDSEVCLMYFTTERMRAEIDTALNGERPDKEDNYFYPTGRCATFLTMHPIFDPHGFIESMKLKLAVYPDALAAKLTEFHMGFLDDTEDLERAVSRSDALFYHFALDLALDHFLQALYAMNKRFFPSRKRTQSHLAQFERKPVDCEDRLLQILRLGGNPSEITQSYALFCELARELRDLVG